MSRFRVIFAVIMLLGTPALAADHCVSPTGSGTESGADWSNTLGWDALSDGTAFVRGDTYFLSDGEYAAKTLDDAASGTTYIYIKKATASDHGTGTGWESAMGDGQALFTAPLVFSTDYWDMNGQYGALDGTFGIKVKRTNSDGKVVTISAGVDHINLTWMDLENAGYSSTWGNADVLYAYGSSGQISFLNFTNVWFHKSNRVGAFLWNVVNSTWDNCWFTEIINMDTYGVHGEGISAQDCPDSGVNTVKNTTFRNIEGTAWIGFMNNGDAYNYNWNIYNNLFYVDADHILDGYLNDGAEPSVTDFTGSNGIIDVLSGATATNINIYGNTFANIQQDIVIRFSTECTNCEVRNNLYVHASRTGEFTADIASNNLSTTDTSYVTDYLNFDLTLAKATSAGYTLSSPYATDKAGIARGGDDTWDIGAYEFDGGVADNPSVSTPSSIAGSFK